MKQSFVNKMLYSVIFCMISFLVACSAPNTKIAEKKIEDAYTLILVAKTMGASSEMPHEIKEAETLYQAAVQDFNSEPPASRLRDSIELDQQLKQQSIDKALMARRKAEEIIRTLKETGIKTRSKPEKQISEEERESLKKIPMLVTKIDEQKKEIIILENQLNQFKDEQQNRQHAPFQEAPYINEPIYPQETPEMSEMQQDIPEPFEPQETPQEPIHEMPRKMPHKMQHKTAHATIHAKIEKPQSDKINDPINLYRKGHDLFNARKYNDSIEKFQEFIDVAPEHTLRDNSQYWIGECLYQMREYGQALKNFDSVLPKFQANHLKRNKAADTLLKLLLCNASLGDRETARVQLHKLIELYPETDSAKHAVKIKANLDTN